MHNKRVLITGSHGYIGTNLYDYLTTRGFKVGGIDKRDKNRIHCETFKLPKKSDLCCIIHLAGTENQKNIIEDNIIAAQNIFHEAYEAGIPVIVTTSLLCKNPSNLFSFAKSTIERYAEHYNNYGAQIKVLRLGEVYGGKSYLETKNSSLVTLIKNKKSKIPSIITQLYSRDFIHIDDVCSAIMLALYYDEPIDDIIDIGSGILHNELDLIRMLGCDFIDNSGNDSKISDAATVKPASEIFGFYSTKKIEDYIRCL